MTSSCTLQRTAVAHTNVLCHTHEWPTLQHCAVAHTNVSRHTCKCVMSHIRTTHVARNVAHTNASCHTHIRMRHIMHMHDACVTLWKTLPTPHIIHLNDACHIICMSYYTYERCMFSSVSDTVATLSTHTQWGNMKDSRLTQWSNTNDACLTHRCRRSTHTQWCTPTQRGSTSWFPITCAPWARLRFRPSSWASRWLKSRSQRRTRCVAVYCNVLQCVTTCGSVV